MILPPTPRLPIVIYDRILVPLIFESYVRDLAERPAKLEPQDVLR
jgi:hypothetical protein